MIRRLLAKELRHHGRVGLGALLLALSTYVLVVEFLLREEAPTLLRAGTMFAWGAGPILAAFVARRLLVLEQEQGTFRLLRSLPVRPATVVATKYGLGLTLVLGVNLGLLWTTALLQRHHELVPAEWVLRLSVQIATYAFAWFSLAALMAQLGGYRYAAWLFVMLLLSSFDDVVHEPTRHLFWTAPLADDLETTRYGTPWDAVALGAAWGLGFLAATIALAQLRGGRLVDAAFQPMTARRRAQVTGGLFVAMLGLELLSGLAGGPPAAPVAPAAASQRVVVTEAALAPLAARVEAAVDDLEARFAIGPLPKVLLRVRRDDRPEAVLTTMSAERLIVAVRTSTPSVEMTRLILTDVLMGHTSMQLERAPRTGVWALGLAPFVLEDDTLGDTSRRLRDMPVALLDDYEALRVRYGRRGVEAAGRAAWRAVDAVGGPEATAALVDALFGASRSGTGAGLIAARSVSPWSVLEDAGVDRERFTSSFRADTNSGPEDASPPFEALRLQARPGQVEALAWRAPPVDPRRHRVELRWATGADLHPLPVPQGPLHGARVTDSDRGRQPLLLDPRQRIVATWVVDGETLRWHEVER